MERTSEILEAVRRVNERIELLVGPNPWHCVLYSGWMGKALLLNARGGVVFEFEDEDPAVACSVCYEFLEHQLWLFFHSAAQ